MRLHLPPGINSIGSILLFVSTQHETISMLYDSYILIPMKTEKDKMISGENYDPYDPQLVRDRKHTRDLLKKFNDSEESQTEERKSILAKLFNTETDIYIQPPFFCDYGSNITLGKKIFMNFNCVILDVAPVEIGDFTLLGPAVQVYTAMHPLSADERRQGIESGKPIKIGADVWIGGNAVICPGVSIGSRSIIGAGSVVTRDIPEDVFAAGNPCRVIRSLTS